MKCQFSTEVYMLEATGEGGKKKKLPSAICITLVLIHSITRAKNLHKKRESTKKMRQDVLSVHATDCF